jgi:hypothetical protein
MVLSYVYDNFWTCEAGDCSVYLWNHKWYTTFQSHDAAMIFHFNMIILCKTPHARHPCDLTTPHRSKCLCFSLKITEHCKITVSALLLQNLIHLWNIDNSHLNRLIIYTEQDLSWKTDSWSACQEIPGLLWKMKIHYNITRAQHWRHPNPVPTLTLHSKTPPSYLYLHLSRGSLTKILYAFLSPLAYPPQFNHPYNIC